METILSTARTTAQAIRARMADRDATLAAIAHQIVQASTDDERDAPRRDYDQAKAGHAADTHTDLVHQLNQLWPEHTANTPPVHHPYSPKEHAMVTTNDHRRAELLAERHAATFAQIGGRDDAIRYLADGPLPPALDGTYTRTELWALAAEVIDDRPEVLTHTPAQVAHADRERRDRIADLILRAGAAKAAGHLAECLTLLPQERRRTHSRRDPPPTADALSGRER